MRKIENQGYPHKPLAHLYYIRKQKRRSRARRASIKLLVSDAFSDFDTKNSYTQRFLATEHSESDELSRHARAHELGFNFSPYQLNIRDVTHFLVLFRRY
jgi:hypothetical protein